MKKRLTRFFRKPRRPSAADFIERYTEEFDARTGMGGIELWIPVRA